MPRQQYCVLSSLRIVCKCMTQCFLLHEQDVPGGRISSAQFANQSVELGSQWLYGSYNNPLSMLAQLFDARMALAHSIPSQESESLSYHASSFPLTATSDINRSSSISQPINVQKYALFEISRTYEKTGERLTGSPSSLFQFEDVTGQMPSVDENFMVDGPNTVSLGELHKIVYGLTDLLNVGTSERTGVLFHAVVASIHLDDLNVTVTLGNGTSYKAQYVISTMPLGVLKEDSINFFPPLPQETYDVIRKLGFQTTNPVHLLFEHPFWIVESEMLTINSEPDDGWKHFLSLYTFLGRPLLVALPGDRASRSMENMTDADVISTVVSILRTEFGTEKVPEPQQAMVTQWGLNPFARGTHSCVTSENSPKDRSTLAEPVRGCMLFAGEAVSIWHPATAHGALFSGIDQARRILSAMELPQGLYDENSECTMECHESSEISFERSTTESIHPASP